MEDGAPDTAHGVRKRSTKTLDSGLRRNDGKDGGRCGPPYGISHRAHGEDREKTLCGLCETKAVRKEIDEKKENA
jgi:hypothetical protein